MTARARQIDRSGAVWRLRNPRSCGLFGPVGAAISERVQGAGTWSSVRVGLALSAQGFLAKSAWAVALIIVVGGVVAAVALSSRSHDTTSLASLPGLFASVLAWGGGMLLAFGAGFQAFRHDVEHGVVTLFRMRQPSFRRYFLARALGLASGLFLMIAGGTLIVGFVSTALAARLGLALRVFASTLATLPYAAAFSITLSLVALATLGARSRGGGYLSLLLVLVIPEWLERWTMKFLPVEFFSIPGALGTLREAMMPSHFDAALVLRALLFLALVAGGAWLVAEGQLRRVTRESP